MKKILLLVLFTLITSLTAFAALYTVNTSRNWSALAPTPTNADSIYVTTGAVLTINVANATCHGIQLGSLTTGGGAGVLYFNAGSQLTVATNISFGAAGSSTRYGVVNMTAGGTLICESMTFNGNFNTDSLYAGLGTISTSGTYDFPTNQVAVSSLNIFNITGGTVGLGVTTPINSLTISSGATLNANNHNITMSGNWTKDGTFTASTGTVTFNGSSVQTIGGTMATTFDNLTINNASGVSLGASETVNGTLTLTNGVVTTGANTLSVGSAGTVARTNGWVGGNLQRYIPTGGTTRTFNIGDAAGYRPVTVNFGTVTTAGNLTATVSQSSGDHPDISTSGINSSRSVNRYWTMTNSGVVFNNYSITLNFLAGDVDAGAGTARFVVRKFNSPSWAATTIGTRTGTSTQATGLTSFSDFAIGEQLINHYVVSAASPQTAGSTFSTTVTAQDILNQTTSLDNTTVVTMSGTGNVQFDSNGDGTFGDNTKTLTAGTFNINTKDNTAETITLTATDGNSATGTSTPVVINPANKLAFGVQPVTTASGSSITPSVTVKIEDVNGNVVTGDTRNVTLAIGTNPVGGTLSGTTTVAAVSGIATFSNLSIDKVGTGYTLAATSNPVLTGATSGTFDITPGALHHFAIADISSPQIATIPFSITITALDANNNTVTGFSGTVNLSSNTGTIAPTTSGGFNSGVRTESVTLTQAGTGRTIGVDDGAGHTATSNTFTLNKTTTTGTLTTTPNPSTFEQSVTMKDSVGSGTVPDGGKVYFNVDGAIVDSAAINGSGVATVSNAGLVVGTHAIGAFFGGTGSYDTSTSNIVSQVVNQTNPTVTLNTSLNPSTFEQNVTFTAHVDNSSHTPTGSVDFYDGVTLLGNVALVGDSAQTSTAALTAGSHTIKVVYSGDSNFKSDSTTLTQVVNQSGPTVTLKSSLNPSTFEQNVTFTAHVDNSSHTPTGSVDFYDGVTLLGNVALVGDSAQTSTAALTAGSHTIKVVYSGDSNFKSDSTTLTQVVNQSGPTVTLKSSLNPSTFEQNVTFTAHVDNSSHTPTGTVDFYDGVTLLGNVPLVGDSAQTSTAALTAGSHTIKVVYSGDSNFKSDSTTLTQVVNQSGPTVTLKSSLNPSNFEQNVTFTAHVDNSSHTPTGSVDFYDGVTLLGNVALVGDSAQTSTATLTAGSHTIKVVYSGDSNFKSDSTTLTQVVNQSGPTVTLNTSLNPSNFEQNVTFTAHVDNSSHTPTGTVDFYDGVTLLGNVALVGDSAQTSTAALTAGSHTIKVVYSGDSNFKSDSTTLTQVVNTSGPTVTLKSSLNPSTFEQNVTFTAHVDNSSHTPTGTVNFYDGVTLLGNVALVGDSAQTSTAALTAGSHTIKVVYSGDSNFKSDSTTLTQVVNTSGPTVTLKSSLNPSTFEQNVTFTAHVDNSSHTPTGTVDFYDGVTLLGNVALVGDSAQTSTAALTAGSHTIKVVYSGDSNFKSDSTTLTQVVNQSGPTVTLKSSLNPSTFEQNVTFTAHVDNSSHTPTGTVDFYDGVTLLGNVALVGDSAQTSTAALTAGSHTIKVVYSGDSNFKSDSTTLTQVVNQSGPTVTLKSSLNPSTFGQSVTFTAHVDNSSHTPTGNVTFYDGSTSLGNISLVGDSAQVTTAVLTGGSHAIKAVYSGDASFKSDSAAITEIVNKELTASGLHSSLNPSVYGQQVTFSDTVVGSIPDGGKIYFSVNGVQVDTANLNDSGIATYQTSSLNIGTQSVQAFYGGTTNFDTSRSNIVLQVVNPDTFTIISSAGLHGTVSPGGTIKAARGSSVTFTITPDTGYAITDVVVDTVSVGVVGLYKFPNIAANHTISASFSYTNHPPVPGLYITPVNRDTIEADSIPSLFVFRWHAATDPDVMDTLRYTLHVNGPGLDTSLVNQIDTTVSLDLASKLQAGSTYSWMVSVNDGHVTVASVDTFTFTIKLATGVKDSKVPRVYALYQNYPNPFNPTTTIQYDIPRQSVITLRIYNILGAEVTTLVDRRTVEQGVYNQVLNGNNLATGVYFYRLEAKGLNGASFVSVKKLLLMK
jgi:hypothetical protein